MSPATPSANWVKIGQAAQILGVSVKTLRRWEETGKITVIRTPGGTRLYSLQMLEGLVKQAEGGVAGAGKLPTEPQPQDNWSKVQSTIQTEWLGNLEQQDKEQRAVPVSFIADNPPSLNHYFEEEDFNPVKVKVNSLAVISTVFLIFTTITTAILTFSYLNNPSSTKSFFAGGNLPSQMLAAALSPFNFLAQKTAVIISPQLAFVFTTPNLPAKQSVEAIALDEQSFSADDFQSNQVLGADATQYYLNIAPSVVMQSDLAVGGSINGLTLTPATDGFSLSGGTTARTLTVSGGNVTLNQDVSTTGTPTFGTLTLSAASNQLLFSGGSALSWAPTGTKTITLPDATGTVVLGTATQTLTNKTISGSDNTLSNIANSALSNSKVTLSAGTNLTGGGDVNLGSSVTLTLKDSIALAGTLTMTGQILAAGGTVTAPGISFSADTNSGLYRLGADTISLITGGTASQGITIDSAGEVGVGTTDPGFTLDVNGIVNATALYVDGEAYIGSQWTSSTNDLYYTTGNVGIGTSVPTAGITIGAGTNNNATEANSAYVAGDLEVDGSIYGSFSGDVSGDITPTGFTQGPVVFGGVGGTLTQSNNFFWDNSGGNVGIGTTAPSSLLDVRSARTSGTLLNVNYSTAQTLTGALIGIKADLNDGYVTPTNQDVTGLRVVLPTTTNTNGVDTTVTLSGMSLGFGAGVGINQNGAGAMVYNGASLSLPALTQTQGTLTANGMLVTTPSSITTGGTANGINISPTGVGAGTLIGVNIGAISSAGAGTETAINVGTGWDNVLKVGSTAVINGSGVVQVAGGGTNITSYTAGDMLYASDTTVFTKLAAGVVNNGKVLVVSDGVPAWGVMDGSSCTDCVVNDPTSVTTQTITPNNQDISSLVVRQTTHATPTQDIFQVTDKTGGTKYFYVDSSGNVSTGAISNTSITLTPTSDTTALTLVGTNVSTAKLAYFNAKNLQGTIFDISYGAAATLTANQTLIGQSINLSTNVTANSSSTNPISVTNLSLTLPAPTNTNTSGTNALKGIAISAGSGINQNGVGGTTTFTGVDITIPALTQTAGTLTGNGILVTTSSSITTAGTANGINISPTGIGAGSLNGINIGTISSPGVGTETALNIGTGWDYGVYSQTAGYSYFAGNVGIGTTAPGNYLSINGTGGEYPGIKILDGEVLAAELIDGRSTGEGGLLNLYESGELQLRFMADGSVPNFINKGNVGIGTTVPGSKLDIGGVTPTAAGLIASTHTLAIGGSTNARIYLQGTTQSDIMFDDSDAAGNDKIFQVKGFNQDLEFRTLTDAGAVETEIMYLDNTGNIGIGTTAPLSLLHVGGTDNTTAAYGLQFGSDTNLYRSAADTLKTDDSLTVGGGTLTVGGAASVAVGHDRLDGNLVLQGFSGSNNGAYFNITGKNYAASPGAGSAEFTIGNTTGTYASKFSLWSYDYASTWTERFRLTGSSGDIYMNWAGGNTGIGTTAPGGRLTVNNGSGTFSPLIVQDNGTAVFTIANNGPITHAPNTSVTTGTLFTIDGPASTLTGALTGLSVDVSGTTPGTQSVTALSTTAFTGGGNGTTNYGLNIGAVTGSGTSTNYGAYIGTVSGGSTYNIGLRITGTAAADVNYAIYADAAAKSYFAGNVGIGTTSPTAALDIAGASSVISNSAGDITIDSTSNNISLATDNLINIGGLADGGTATAGQLLWTGGNVGIGTTAPAGLFEVLSGAATTAYSYLTTSHTGGRSLMSIRNTGASGGALSLRTHGSTYSETLFGVSMTSAASILGQSGDNNPLVIGNYNSGPLVLGTNNSERMRITAGGNVGIGTTSPYSLLDVNGTGGIIVNSINSSFLQNAGGGGLIYSSTGSGAYPFNALGNLIIQSRNDGSANNRDIVFVTNSQTPAVRMVINNVGNVGIGTTAPSAYNLQVNGSLGVSSSTTVRTFYVGSGSAGGTMAWSNDSDARLKTDVQPIENALEKVMSLQGVEFNWKDSSKYTDARQIGFIAQDAMNVVPEVVDKPGEYYGMQYAPLTALLTEAIKEQQTIINNLITNQATTSALLSEVSVDSSGNLSIPSVKLDKLVFNPTDPTSGLSSLTSDGSTISYTDKDGNVAQVLTTNSQTYYDLTGKIATAEDRLASLENRVYNLEASSYGQVAGEATSSATPVYGPIPEEASPSATLALTPPEILMASGSATLADITVTSDATVSGILTAYQTTIQDTFKSLGDAFLGNTTVAGDFAVDGTLSLTGDSINSLSTLYIQNSSLAGGVDFFNGLVTVDSTGTLTAQKLALSTNTLGSGTITSGQTSVTISTTALTTKSKVFLTVTSPTGGQITYVSSQTPGSGFTVSINQTYTSDITFNWMIVDTTD